MFKKSNHNNRDLLLTGYTRGITAVELLVAVAILVLVIIVVIPQFSKIKSNQILKDTTDDVISALHQAQSQTLASVNSSQYGVHLQSDRVIIFTGTTYSSGASSNQTILISSPASITNVTLNGSSGTSGDVVFSRLSGTPDKTGTVTVYTSSLSKTVTISAAGTISLN